MWALAVFLQVVGHVGGAQVLAAHLAGDLVLVAGQVRAQTVPRGKRGITDLWTHRQTVDRHTNTQTYRHTQTDRWID